MAYPLGLKGVVIGQGDTYEAALSDVRSAIRLLNMPRKKRMESVKRHRLWQKQLKRDEFFKEIFGKYNNQI